MSFLTAISSALQAFFLSIVTMVQSVFLSLWTMFQDVFLWTIDQVLTLVTSILSTLNLAFITSHAGAFGSIPSETLNVMGLLGFGDCMAVIASAIGIRILLQLIPFTRLGS